MNFESVKAWLEKQTARETRVRWIYVVVGMLLTPIGIAAGFLLILLFAWVATAKRHHGNLTPGAIWTAVASVPLMFVINALIRPSDEPEKFYHDDTGPDNSLVGGYMHRRKVQGQFIFWILLTGPRLVDWVVGSFKQIHRLKNQDTHSCAAVLFVLLLKGKRVSYPDIQQELDWLDVEATAPQLKWLEGVLFVNVEPPAISLTDDLRMAIKTGAPPP